MKMRTTPKPASVKPQPSFLLFEEVEAGVDLEGVVLEAALNDLISNDLFGCSKARAN